MPTSKDDRERREFLQKALRAWTESPAIADALPSDGDSLRVDIAVNEHEVSLLVGPPVAHRLTPREIEVLEHLGRDVGNAGIARELDISEGTVATYLKRIYNKLGIHSRAALARWAERTLG